MGVGGANEGEMEMNGGEERLKATREIIESLLAFKSAVWRTLRPFSSLPVCCVHLS